MIFLFLGWCFPVLVSVVLLFFAPRHFAILRSSQTPYSFSFIPQNYVFVWNLTSTDSQMEIFWYFLLVNSPYVSVFGGNKKPAKNTGEIMKMKQNQCFRPLNVSSVAMLDMSGNPTVCGDDGKCREIQQVEKLLLQKMWRNGNWKKFM